MPRQLPHRCQVRPRPPKSATAPRETTLASKPSRGHRTARPRPEDDQARPSRLCDRGGHTLVRSGNDEAMDTYSRSGSSGSAGRSRRRALLSSAVLRVLAFVVCAAACSGCGGERRFVEPLAVTGSGLVRFLASPPPASTAPGLGPANLVFLSERIGFVATTGGGFEQ